VDESHGLCGNRWESQVLALRQFSSYDDAMADYNKCEVEVRLDEERSICLAGLIFRAMLRRSLSKPSLARLASRLRGIVEIQAGRMVIFLVMEPGIWVIQRGTPSRPTARIRGDMKSLISAGAGRLPVMDLLRLRLRPRGNLWVLLALFWIMRG